MKFNSTNWNVKSFCVLILLTILISITAGCRKYEINRYLIVDSNVDIDIKNAEISVKILTDSTDINNFVVYKLIRTIKPFKLVISANTKNLEINLLHVESIRIDFTNGSKEQYGSKSFQFNIPKDLLLDSNSKKRRFREENDDFIVGYKINSNGILTTSIHYKNVVNQYSDCTVYVKGFIQSDKGRNNFQSVDSFKFSYSEHTEIGPRN